MPRTTTLESHLLQERRRRPEDGVGAVLLDVAAGVKAISAVLGRAVVCGAVSGTGGDGEPASMMDLLANDLLLDACLRGGHVAAAASPLLDEPHLAFGHETSPFLLAMKPLDGASNLCLNVTAGTIFSVLPRRDGVPLGPRAFLQEGARQLAAGYALYGPCTMLVLTTGCEVRGFTLDESAGSFVLTHPELRIPEQERALPAGVEAAWLGATAADVHRVLLRGGMFVAPRNGRDPERPGTLGLLCEASPVAMLVELAGGVASTGRERLLDVVPRDVHERVPIVLGSRGEVERAVAQREDAELPGSSSASPPGDGRALRPVT